MRGGGPLVVLAHPGVSGLAVYFVSSSFVRSLSFLTFPQLGYEAPNSASMSFNPLYQPLFRLFAFICLKFSYEFPSSPTVAVDFLPQALLTALSLLSFIFNLFLVFPVLYSMYLVVVSAHVLVIVVLSISWIHALVVYVFID